ncbi:uncharacterized protein PV07_10899 [Cladophialophora immunda]|uniref:Major facilitator superfamily (MFS) profile domain-containing protein n=1 Tax=Cladophialophora immunda TaxID=569365 RepID=A0A0D2CGH4_9EURO|nr:uncharacterized protein PV07_10899 [Cladophialophora immunda]KIW22619.1 hypothetical protein PV07_10899 [Cladophialophora immunda]
MALPDWLDDSRNPTLWITTIYPLLIFVLAYASYFRMQALIESFPLPPDDSADTKEIENETLEAGDASSADYDMVADDATMTTGRADKPSSSTEAPDPRVASKRNESTTPKQKSKRPSLHTKYVQGFLIYGLQVLLTQRLGVLAISRAHESHSFAAKLFCDGVGAKRATFFASKFIQSSAIGGVLCTTQTYMSEILPPKLRGSIMAFFPVFTLLGQLIGAVVVYSSLDYPGNRSYTTPIIAQWPFSAVPLVLAALIPESPTYLLRKKQFDRAFKSQKRLDSSRTNTQTNIDNLIFSLQKEEESAKYDRATYTECFQDTNRRRTLLVIFANILPQLFGLSLLSDASYFIQMVGMSADNALLFLQLGVGLGLLANIISMWVLTKVGRRILMMITLVITTVLWLGMGVAGCFEGVVVI